MSWSRVEWIKQRGTWMVLLLLALEAGLARVVAPARLAGPESERLLGYSLLLGVAAITSLITATTWKSLERPQKHRFAALFPPILLMACFLSQVVTYGSPPPGMNEADGAWRADAFGPVTTWPGFAASMGPLHVFASLGFVIALLAGVLLLSLALARGKLRLVWLGAAAAWAMVTACPACIPWLAQWIRAATPDPFAPWMSVLPLVPATLGALGNAPRQPGSLRPATGLPMAAAFGLPVGGSAGSAALHRLFDWFSAAAGLVAATFFGALAWLLWRHRDRGAPRVNSKLTDRSRTVWQVVFLAFPTILLAVLGWASLATLHDIDATHANPTEIHVDGMQWAWRFSGPGNDNSTNELHVRAGQPVRLFVTSLDVGHSLYVPDLAIRVDAQPGETNTFDFLPLRPGTYSGVCAEFCGYAHPSMSFRVVVDP